MPGLHVLKAVYSPEMVPEIEPLASPSAGKPRDVATALAASGWPVEIVRPEPMPVEALYRVHAKRFVDEVLQVTRLNGFGSLSAAVSQSLRFTCGAFHTGALIALREGLSASLTSGFHHARFASARGFCTFNGLVASAAQLLDQGLAGRVAIVDCDFHFGDGTQTMIEALELEAKVLHVSLGQYFRQRVQAREYLAAMRELNGRLARFSPDIVFFQAGADVHVDDPLGGLLTTVEMRERDRTMFEIARALRIPLTWNLAGGYQRESDGSIPRVVALHLNTFEEALAVWRLRP